MTREFFKCANNRCVKLSVRCDNFNDCVISLTRPSVAGPRSFPAGWGSASDNLLTVTPCRTVQTPAMNYTFTKVTILILILTGQKMRYDDLTIIVVLRQGV